jgi:hypothetical protein
MQLPFLEFSSGLVFGLLLASGWVKACERTPPHNFSSDAKAALKESEAKDCDMAAQQPAISQKGSRINFRSYCKKLFI